MLTVKQLFDSLSAEERRTLALGLCDAGGECKETAVKISHLLNDHKLAGKVKEFIDLVMNDYERHLVKTMSLREDEELSTELQDKLVMLKKKHGDISLSGVEKEEEKEEGMKQIQDYFESLSHQHKRTVAKDLFGGDEQKRMKALAKLRIFDGDLRENTRLFVDLVLAYIGSLEFRQNDCIEMKIEADKKESEYLAVEEKRVEDVVRTHKELHPPQIFECPVCLEEVENTEHHTKVYFYCCGQGTCFSCCLKNKDSRGGLFNGKCPLCRGDIVTEATTRYKRIKKWAEKGYSWAQMKMATYYLTGCQEANIPIDERKHVKWLKLSCENESPDLDAICSLAKRYEDGKTVEKSKEKAIALMKKAADMGSRRAQDAFAISLEDNEEKGLTAESVYHATLAIAERPPFNPYGYGVAAQSAFVLGNAFLCGEGGMEQNIYLARHYFSIAVQGNKDAIDPKAEVMVDFKDGYERAYWYYAQALLFQGMEAFGEYNISVPGFSPMPKAMYWFHKIHTLAVGCACGNPKCWKEVLKVRAKKWMDKIKSEESQKCSYCLNTAEECPGGTLKSCARCSGAWYCGRECQIAAWKAGHKLDCVKLDGPADAALH